MKPFDFSDEAEAAAAELIEQLKDTVDNLSAENAKLRGETQDWFKRYQGAVGENDKLRQRLADANSKNAGVSKLLRRKESYAIDAKIEFDKALRIERSHVAKLQSRNAKLREQLAEAVELLSRLNYTFLPSYDTAAIDAFVAQFQDANNANH